MVSEPSFERREAAPWCVAGEQPRALPSTRFSSNDVLFHSLDGRSQRTHQDRGVSAVKRRDRAQEEGRDFARINSQKISTTAPMAT